MLVEYEHPAAGLVRSTGSPIRFDGETTRSDALPPMLGQHTRSVLAEAGVDGGTIDKMIQEGTAIEP